LAFQDLFLKNREEETLYHILQRYAHNPMANLSKTVLVDNGMGVEEIKASLRRTINIETENIEKYLNFLATTGATAPFIGLFGTVWGIMDSFRHIGKIGSASLSTVAPSIAEALIATAAGLAAAIPAVIAYNYFAGRVRRFITNMEDFSEELLAFYIKRGHETTEKSKLF
ncbi:MAG: hypothetical protein D6828_03105, partial [Nitrospirae bacterium]